MQISSTEIKRLICNQCNVPNPFNIYILDREKILPCSKDVVDFIRRDMPEFKPDQQCEDKALQTIAAANRIFPEWCHGIVTISRPKFGDVHTVCIFIDNKKIVKLYDPANVKYVAYEFEINLVVIF